MNRVIALIPARAGSKGVPGKNWRLLDGVSCVQRAVDCAVAAGVDQIVLSTDRDEDAPSTFVNGHGITRWLYAQAPLHTDECAMIDVVKDALARGCSEMASDVWVLLQPSSPLRTPLHVESAVRLLRTPIGVEDDEDERTTHWDAVASVVEADPIEKRVIVESGGHLTPQLNHLGWHDITRRRQDLPRSFKFDGTVYAFWRRTVETSGTIFGYLTRALIIAPEQSLSIDTPSDWDKAESVLKMRALAGHDREPDAAWRRSMELRG